MLYCIVQIVRLIRGHHLFSVYTCCVGQWVWSVKWGPQSPPSLDSLAANLRGLHYSERTGGQAWTSWIREFAHRWKDGKHSRATHMTRNITTHSSTRSKHLHSQLLIRWWKALFTANNDEVASITQCELFNSLFFIYTSLGIYIWRTCAHAAR